MSPRRLVAFLAIGLACLNVSLAANINKRQTTVEVTFVKSSLEDWNSEDAESSQKETVEITDHNPGYTATKRMTFTAFEKDWTLALQKNTMMFGKDMAFEIRDVRSDSILKTLAAPKDCLYIGKVDAGENESGLVSLSNCGGKLTATLITNLNDYMINPVIRRRRKRAPEEDPIDLLKRHINNTIYESRRFNTKRSSSFEEILHQPLLRPEGRVLFFETGVVIDRTFTDKLYQDLGIDEDEIPRYVTDLLQTTQLWYLHPTLGYQVWLTLQKVIIIQYDIPIPNGIASKLAAACDWQAKTYSADSTKWDATFILTGDMDILGGIGGLAYPGTACGQASIRCAGIALNPHQSLMSRSIAHEGAHVLGPMDDYVKPYVDICYSGMMREGLFEDRDWSICSVQMLEGFLMLKKERNTCLQSDSTPSVPILNPPKLPSNIAWRVKAKQSSTYHSEVAWGAWKAVDGSIAGVPFLDPNPILGSCTRTQAEKDPWLMITLPDEYSATSIASIHVYNRPDCCSDRLHDFEVRVGDDENFRNNPVCFFHEGAVPGGRYGLAVVQCDQPLSGRYVSVQIKGGAKETLTICELMVYQDIQLPLYENPQFECTDGMYGCPVRARLGQCSQDFMKTDCAFTCGLCSREVPHPTISTGTIHPPHRTDEPSCRDKSRACHHFLANGDCMTGDNMNRCPLSCGNCKPPTTTPATTRAPTTAATTVTTPEPPCVDQHAQCPSWAAAGHCALNPSFLHVQCRKSCGLCRPGGCADQDFNCVAWANAGLCQSSPHIVPMCKKSCNSC